MDEQLENIKNEVLRKIGRNMLLIQRVEHMLKFLIANGKVSGSASELPNIRYKQKATIHKQTMGQLVGQFLSNAYSAGTDDSDVPDSITEPHFSFNFTIETDEGSFEARKQALASIVAERNELIHHFLPRFNPSSLESCQEAENYLDGQREKLVPEIENLRSLVDALQNGRKLLAEFLQSDEGKEHFRQSWLRQSRLVNLLQEFSVRASRDDGWTLLNVAGHFLHQYAPDEMANLKNKYGHSTLKGVILATDLFEIFEEPTNKGGVRVLYKPKALDEIDLVNVG
jgi:hypothetical protein